MAIGLIDGLIAAALAETAVGSSVRRFWKRAEAVAAEDGWGIELDGKPLRTPGKLALVVPSEALGAGDRGGME